MAQLNKKKSNSLNHDRDLHPVFMRFLSHFPMVSEWLPDETGYNFAGVGKDVSYNQQTSWIGRKMPCRMEMYQVG